MHRARATEMHRARAMEMHRARAMPTGPREARLAAAEPAPVVAVVAVAADAN